MINVLCIVYRSTNHSISPTDEWGNHRFYHILKVTALNGASTAQEAEDGDEDDTSPSARRLGGSLSDVSRRGLQTESGSSSVSDGSGSSEVSGGRSEGTLS